MKQNSALIRARNTAAVPGSPASRAVDVKEDAMADTSTSIRFVRAPVPRANHRDAGRRGVPPAQTGTGCGVALTWTQTEVQVYDIAAGLIDLGVQAEQRVAIMAGTPGWNGSS